MGLVYFAFCYVALSIDVTSGAASVWPASGLMFAAVLLVPARFIPAILLGSIVGGSAANLAAGFLATTSVGYALINAVEGVAGRWLVKRYCADAPRLSQPLNGFALIACGVSACVAGAFVAATLATFTSHARWLSVFGTWSASCATGIVIVAPVIFATASAVSELRRPLPRARVIEAIVILAVLVLDSAWLYLADHPSPLDQFANTLLILPLIAWAAVRFEAAGAAWSVLIVNAFSIWGTTLGYGPLLDVTPSSIVNLLIQARIAVTGMVALSLGAAVGAARRSAAVHRRLALDLQAAADRERSRLSHELHDEVAQKLAALKMQLQLTEIAPELDRRKSTASSVGIVNDLLADVRAMSHSLRPAPFDEGQLFPALNALAKWEATRGRLNVIIEPPEHDIALPRDIELVCYRVIREAIGNVVKHARARKVRVFLNDDSGRLTLSISDDGCGFDVAPTIRQAVRDGHLGLVGMRERLSRVGGTLNVSSTLGRGTTVTCFVPLGVAA